MPNGPLGHFDAHHRLALALMAALAGFLVTRGRVGLPVLTIVVWNVFCWALLVLAWMRIIWGEPAAAARVAHLQDSERSLIFLIVVICTCASLFAVAYLLGTAKSLQAGKLTWHVMLAIGTVLASWSLMHTVFALHYAHIYYRKGDEDVGTEDDGGGAVPRRDEARLHGLQLLLVRDRDDLSGVRRADHLAANTPARPRPRRALVRVQHGHPRPQHQHHLEPALSHAARSPRGPELRPDSGSPGPSDRCRARWSPRDPGGGRRYPHRSRRALRGQAAQ